VAVASGEEPSERRLSVRRERVAKAAPARLRALELSETQILVVATDSQRQLTWWTAMADPRFLRAETSDDQGHLVDGGGLYRRSVAFVLEVPDDQQTVQLEVYHPRWNGATFELEPLGVIARSGQ
jgi:hypothetical protein